MKCRYYKHLIILAKTETISTRQGKQLRKHLNECSQCKKDWEQQLRMDEVIKSIKEKEVKPYDPKGLTNQILIAIQNKDHVSMIERLLLVVDRFQYLLFYRRLKYALITLSILFVGLLGLQHFEFIHDKSRLSEEVKRVKYKPSASQDANHFYLTGLGLEQIFKKDNKTVKLSKSEYNDLIIQLLTLEKENMELRNMLVEDYEQVLTKIELEKQEDLTPEQKVIIKKLKEI